MSKRQRFIITSVLLTVGFGLVNLYEAFSRFWEIVILGVLTLALFSFSLKEGLRKDARLLTLVLPTLYTVGVGIFWFLVPSNFYARIPVLLIYGAGIYALCLTQNIFTVSAIRTIALLRSARGVGFVLTLFTFFLLYDAILSLRINPLISSLAIGTVSFLLFLQGYWMTSLKKVLEKDVLWLSILSPLIMVQMSIIIFFWPVSVVVGSLFLTITVYVLLGLGQAKIEGRLFKNTIREYIILGVLVFLGMVFSTSWGS
ncbi:hypothetical protein JXA63_02965 [Candidatus Woesebacteria bacterium]|nr:hypothetical protein [Candidatus Woesebacteria bacterium]